MKSIVGCCLLPGCKFLLEGGARKRELTVCIGMPDNWVRPGKRALYN